MHKVAIIVCWFGSYPSYFDLWKKSVAWNPDIDFLFWGDHDLGDEVPKNLHFFKTTLSDMAQRFKNCLHHDRLNCEHSYKLCDFRPLYGEVFADVLSGYDFWGHCDIDLVFGNLRSFLTEDKLSRYDKVYPCGHFSVYRNTPEVNARWRLPYGKFQLEDVLTQHYNFDFDEWDGIYNIYMRQSFPFYRQVDFYDPLCFTRRFRFRQRSNPKYERPPQDYCHQCFYWEQGRVYRAYEDQDGSIKQEEAAYMHFQKRRFPTPSDVLAEAPAFFCTPTGFKVKSYLGVPSRSDICRMNPYSGSVAERFESWFLKKKNKLLLRMHVRKNVFAPESLKIPGASWTCP